MDAVLHGEAATRGAGSLDTLLLEHNEVLASGLPGADTNSARGEPEEPPGTLPPELERGGAIHVTTSASVAMSANGNVAPPPPGESQAQPGDETSTTASAYGSRPDYREP